MLDDLKLTKAQSTQNMEEFKEQAYINYDASLLDSPVKKKFVKKTVSQLELRKHNN